MKNLAWSKYKLLLVLLFLVLFQFIININTFYVSDPLIKMIQVISLWDNNWTTEGIIYPAFSFDPDFLLSPFNDGFIFKNNDRLIGNYPIAFTFLYSLFGFISFQYLPYLNVLFLFLFIHLLNKNKINTITIIYIILGTIVFPLLLDFSENGIFLVLGSYGYVNLWKAHIHNEKKHWILGNIFLGASLWFRLEGILFFATIQFTILIIEFSQKEFKFTKLLRFERYIIFLFILILFLLWNQYSYSHPLGTRYLATYSNSGKSFLTQLQLFLSMIFTYPRENGYSFGFFLLSPILFFALINSIKVSFQNRKIEFHIMVVSFFILLVGITSPNDGITLTGRYFLLSITPFAFILHEQFENLKAKKVFSYILITWNLLTSLIVLVIFYFTSVELRKIQAEVKKIESPIVVATNEFISSAFGLSLIEKKVICVRNKDLVPYFYEKLKVTSENEFQIVTVAKVTKYIANEQDIFNELSKSSSQYGYQCQNEIKVGKIMSLQCKKIKTK